MSSVKIQSNASGTGDLIIAAPNTNSTRTINLPDADGDFVTTGDSGTVSASMLASTLDLSGKTVTLPSGTGGKVLQVVSVTDSTGTAVSTSTTYVDMGNLNASITPTSSSSTIIVMALVNNIRLNGAGQAAISLERQINGGGYSRVEEWEEMIGFSDNTTASVTPWFIDTPNTTTQVDYKYRICKRSSAQSVTIVYQNRVADGGLGASNLVLMEIAA